MIRSILRWLFRERTKHEIVHTKQRIAIFYAIVGWNTFGLILYLLLKKKTPDEPENRRIAYGLLSGIPLTNVHVYRVEGMKFTEDYDIAYKAMVEQIEKEKDCSDNKANSKDDNWDDNWAEY